MLGGEESAEVVGQVTGVFCSNLSAVDTNYILKMMSMATTVDTLVDQMAKEVVDRRHEMTVH